MISNGWLLALALCAGLSAGASAEGGKTEVGATACANCHAEKVEAYKRSPHGRSLAAAKDVPFEKSCETCHGPGSAHAEAGDVTAIVNPKKAKDGSAACTSCHAGEKSRMFWAGSVHEKNGCASCHSVHGGEKRLLAKRSELETCTSCHSDVKASLMKRSTHPLRDSFRKGSEGKMACSGCHNPHGSQTEKLMAGRSINDTCYTCHTEKKTPMLWEHGPVKEDCMTCHTPHGSTNDKLLTTRPPRLCQSCHMQGRHQSGTLGQNSVYAVGKACLNCHPMVHGSNHPSGTVLQR
ncbi:DmsE family decaheme c-type cytochrome [bacterium]|nr:MAG: DmsE family decaheme c-type cytochrome [bacterium]